MNEYIIIKNKKILKDKITIKIILDDDGTYIANIINTKIYTFGFTKQEAINNMNDEIIFLYDTFNSERESNFSNNLIKLKHQLFNFSN